MPCGVCKTDVPRLEGAKQCVCDSCGRLLRTDVVVPCSQCAAKLWMQDSPDGGHLNHNCVQVVGEEECGQRPHTDSRKLCKFAAVLYLNPVLRYDGARLPVPTSTVDAAATWTLRGSAGLALALLAGALLRRRRLQGRPAPAGRLAVAKRHTA